MNKIVENKVSNLKENDIIFFEAKRFFLIDTKFETLQGLFQSEDGKERIAINYDERVLQIIDAERGFEGVSLSFRKNDSMIVLPERKTAKSAGYDFISPIDVTILPMKTALIYTDVKAFMEDDEELRLSIRSGLSGKGLILTNGIGIIDADYYNNEENDGNIAFRFINLSDMPVRIDAGDRIGQGVFAKYLTTYDDKANGVRKGGFGSTGR